MISNECMVPSFQVPTMGAFPAPNAAAVGASIPDRTAAVPAMVANVMLYIPS